MLNPLQLSFDFIGEVKRALTGGERAPAPSTPSVAPAHDPLPPAYELRRNPRRRLLSIEVHPDLRVIVRAPQRCAEREVAGFLAERARWIEAQLAYFRRQPRLPPGPGYADGEMHRYLGQVLRLDLRADDPPGVRIAGEYLQIGGDVARDRDSIAQALTAWYRERATLEFTAILDACYRHPRFSRYERPSLHIRAMRTRWGSLGPRRGISLNLILIQAPRACIEFVVMHELCHLRYRGHGKGFYRLLDGVLRDWRERKRLLEETIR